VLANTSGTGVSSAAGGDLEQLAKDIEVHQRIFRGLNLVLEHVKAMDRYLGGIWKEYRTEFQDAQGSYGSFGERLRMFDESSGTRKSDFPNFSVDYHEARRVLLELLIPTAAAHRADKAAIYDASQRTGASK
jgi:hypothetical protein